MPAEEPLTLCAMTLRGASFGDRVAAAAEAGFDAIGLTVDQYRAARACGLDDAAIRGLLAEHGLCVSEVETPWDWAADPSDTSAAAEGDLLFHVLDALDCRRFNAVQFTPHPWADLVDRFAALCRRAADHGVTVALEFMPFSELRTLTDAWSLVEAAGEPNAGVLLDTWHLHRTGGGPDSIAAVPADRIVAVQLNDAVPAAWPDPRYEARHLRRVPGDGVIPLVAILTALRGHGVRAAMSVEVWSDVLETLPPREAAGHAYEATRRVLGKAGQAVEQAVPPRPEPPHRAAAPAARRLPGPRGRHSHRRQEPYVTREDRQDIRDLVENWAVWRDAGDWDRFAGVWHPDGVMRATWFQGRWDEFAEVSRQGFDRGVRILHFLGGSSVDVAGDRAVAQTKMTITQRAEVEGVLCDVVCTGRFYDLLERRGGRWGLVLRQPVYERDRLDPVDPALHPVLDRARLAGYPEGYRHLAYLQEGLGYTVERAMPQLTGPAVEELYARGRAWLAAGTEGGTEAEAVADDADGNAVPAPAAADTGGAAGGPIGGRTTPAATTAQSGPGAHV